MFLYLKPASLRFLPTEFVYEVNKLNRILFTFIQKNSITVAPIKQVNFVECFIHQKNTFYLENVGATSIRA